MTKQEAIDHAWDLLELLESLPDSVDIINTNIQYYFNGIMLSLQIQLKSGVEAVSEKFGIPIKTKILNEYIYKKFHTQNCEFVQLESAADIIKAALGADNTEDGETDGKTI